ncbi:hypothetical protein IL306_006146 [Fusarium sp. DS 682]|nr:hypothetical protein IL306_006146 [Fusarium sp. DS 682]
MTSENPVVTTSYLLGNLHCPTCVTLIHSLLRDAFGDNVLWVSPNLVTSVVTVEHKENSAASVGSMQGVLQDAGFDICGLNTTAKAANDLYRTSQVDGESSRVAEHSDGWLDSFFHFWRPQVSPLPIEAARAAHLQNCQACKSDKIPEKSPSDDKRRLVRVSSIVSDTPTRRSSIPYPLQQVVTETSPTASWRVTLSIGGMTCAVCVNTITQELEKCPWITKVAVNLVSNSATIDCTDGDRAQEIVDAIEGLGYDATIDEVVNLQEKRVPANEREVEVSVDGIFCQRCPERIVTTLKSLAPGRLQIFQEPTIQNPIIRIRYTPDAPRFTIRQILQAIEAADKSLKSSIYHPPTLEERSRIIRAKHQRALLYREILTIIFAIPTFVLGIVYMSLLPDSNHGKMYLMKPWVSGLSRLDICLFALATPVYFFAADVFHIRAIKEVRSMWRKGSRMPVMQRFYRFGSMNMLVSLGTSIAYLSSVAQMIAAGASRRKHRGSGAEMYFDSVVFLTLFLLAGRLIESYSKSKTGDAVEMLGKLRPTTALLIDTDKAGGGQITTTVPVDQLDSGDIIRVPHGASPAADGIVISGETNFDESSLTGESRLIKKAEGDQIFAGTINKAAAVTMRVTGTSGQSMLDQIVQVVREGQTKRAPIEQIADLLTTYFVPVITLIAVLTWTVWMVLGFAGAVPGHEETSSSSWVVFALQFAIAVFVVACPCGLALAAPTAIFVGGGIAAKHGILAKGGGEAFEKASKIDCVVFDKTGTLTEGGQPKITDSIVFPDTASSEEEGSVLLSALKAVEENSSHPIAKAIVSFCGDAPAGNVDNLEELAGRGMKASFKGIDDQEMDMIVGNELLMQDFSLTLPSHISSSLETWKSEAKSVAIVAIKPSSADSWTLAAALSVSDPIRRETIPVIQALTSRGIQVWMLSGDNVTTARAVAQRVGIPLSNVLAEVLPSDKAAKISSLQASLHASGSTTKRATVAMVGDGINDSPALTTADVGIAIGTGSDVAISSAAFVLATSQLTAVVTLLDLSRAVFRRIRVNFAWALVYNMLAVPVAAGCFYPIVLSGGERVRLDPVWAALAMALSSISVVLSSLSLRTRIPGVGFRYRKVDME